MNVIIIDDQMEVVQGMLSGIRWAALGIYHTYCAYSAGDARRIIQNNPVDLMLCDIEMPAEDGLSLYAWVRENYPQIKCIFLTSHMEFDYALKALKMESFDYILQPAKYSVVEETIEKAISCIEDERNKERLRKYGRYWKDNEDEVLDLVLRDIVVNPNVAIDEKKFFYLMNHMGYVIYDNTRFVPLLIHIFQWNTQLTQWEGGLLKNTLSNVIYELFEQIGLNVFFVMINRNEFVCFLYMQNEFDKEQNGDQYSVIDIDRIIDKCNEFEKFSCTYMKIRQGIYVGKAVKFSELPGELKLLYEKDNNNIGRATGVYQDIDIRQEKNLNYRNTVNRWKQLLGQGYGRIFLRELTQYLDSAKEHGITNSKNLDDFHKEFLRIIYEAAAEKGLDIGLIVDEYPEIRPYLKQCQSLNDVLNFGKILVEIFNHRNWEIVPEEQESSIVDRAKEYIESHVAQELSRNEIAEYLYINSDYLSRIFRKKTGVSLKDYIVEMKIEHAKYLMENSPLPVSIVASKVGFANFSYFSQVFKKVTGTTPMEYRKNFSHR